MKRTIIILIFLISGIAFSQRKTVSSENSEKQRIAYKLKLKEEAENKTKALSKELNLSENQRNEVYDILIFHTEKNYDTKVDFKQKLAEKETINKEEARAKLKSIERDNYNSINSAFKKIFSKKQWNQYETMLSQAKTAKKNSKSKY